MKRVAVVILNYKLRKLTLECLKSVKKSSYGQIKVYVVDNDSGDDLKKELGSEITFIQAGSNLGYAGGNNLGITAALKDGCNLIFIINPDTQVDVDCIKSCVELMSSDQTIGVIGPKILFSDKKTIWYAGGIFDRDNVLGTHRGVDQQDVGQFDKIGETDFVSGAAMMVRREVFERIGLFDERYFLYYEDSDFCLRAKRRGFKLVYNPQALVYHKNAQATGLGSPLQDYFITKNRMLLASKFLPLRTRLALLREAFKNLGNPTRRLALFDFLLGRFGQGSYKID